MSEVMEAPVEIRYFDPFTDEEIPDIEAARQAATENYLAGTVEYDTALDSFVKDCEAMVWEARYTDRMELAQDIMARMHQMCGEDHNLSRFMQENSTFGSLFEDQHQNHDHNHEAHSKHQHEDGIDPKTGKKKRLLGKFSIFSFFSRNS
ncbi:MAG TPA: hypothetical protein VGF75_01745 [Candidatus Saccharimonadales bacterium]|jgi:hypothetical protein